MQVERLIQPIQRALLAGLIALTTVNIWTGAPLLAMWVGSLTVGESSLSMSAVIIVVVALTALCLSLIVLLNRLNELYLQVTGSVRVNAAPTGWLRSMRSESQADLASRDGVSALEVIVVINVYMAATTLTLWYLMFAGRPFSLVV